jgi:hypothetical protein
MPSTVSWVSTPWYSRTPVSNDYVSHKAPSFLITAHRLFEMLLHEMKSYIDGDESAHSMFAIKLVVAMAKDKRRFVFVIDPHTAFRLES